MSDSAALYWWWCESMPEAASLLPQNGTEPLNSRNHACFTAAHPVTYIRKPAQYWFFYCCSSTCSTAALLLVQQLFFHMLNNCSGHLHVPTCTCTYLYTTSPVTSAMAFLAAARHRLLNHVSSSSSTSLWSIWRWLVPVFIPSARHPLISRYVFVIGKLSQRILRISAESLSGGKWCRRHLGVRWWRRD